MKTRSGVVRIFVFVLGLMAIGLVQVGAEVRVMDKPSGKALQTVPLEKIQPSPAPCPDLAVTEIRYEIAQTYPDAPQLMAKVRITAVARNQGKGAFPFSGKLQIFGDSQKLAEQPFGTVPPGGEVKISHELKWIVGSSIGQFFIGKIVYDPAVFQNKYEQDCDFYNNEKKRDAQDINNLITPSKTLKMMPKPEGAANRPQMRPPDNIQKAK